MKEKSKSSALESKVKDAQNQMHYADGYLQGFLDCMEEMNKAIRLMDEPEIAKQEFVQ